MAPFETPEEALAHCWQLLVRSSRDRRADWRTPVLSTVGLDGAPRARVLVLRRAEPGAGLLWLHADVRSAKWAELAADPRAALAFWDARRALQLRAEGVARIESDPALLSEAWGRVPEASRRNYSTIDAPGTPCAGAVGHAGDGQANFGLIAVRLVRLEWLWLGPEGHRRGEARRQGEDWLSGALVP
jgi:general stress protein 26